MELRGSMYGVARAADSIQQVEGVNVACFNSASHVTLAVNSVEGESYLEQLRQQGIALLNLQTIIKSVYLIYFYLIHFYLHLSCFQVCFEVCFVSPRLPD